MKSQCSNCRFWSEMLARCNEYGPIEAVCLSEGSHKGKYTGGSYRCDSWKNGFLGAVDMPPHYGEQYASEAP